MQNADTLDPLSYHSIAGIHGYPNIAWDNVDGDFNSSAVGYCLHNGVIFELWHRPYLALFEQQIVENAQSIATQYPDEIRDMFTAAAETLRIPYWDWLISPSLPDVAVSPTINVNTPDGLQIIDNPLWQYNFQVNMSEIIQPYHWPMTIENYTYTARHATPDGISHNDQASQAIQASSASRLQTVYTILTTLNYSWTQIAPYVVDGISNGFANLEQVHGAVHTDIGGSVGHMKYIPMSSYDPIFWLHHAQIDRLTALWQALHPESYVEPVIQVQQSFFELANTIEDNSTPLAPFHSDDNNGFWTAEKARDTVVFGYTYPELIDWNVTSDVLQSNVLQAVKIKYSPNVASNSTSRRRLRRSSNIADLMSDVSAGSALALGMNNQPRQWFLRLTFNVPAQSDGAAVYLFAGTPKGTSTTWSTSRNLIGSFLPYGESTWRSGQHMDIPCTHTVLAAADRGLLVGLAIDDVVQFLADNVVVRVTERNQREFNSASSLGIKLSIVSQSVELPRSLSEFPQYGQLEVHQDIA